MRTVVNRSMKKDAYPTRDTNNPQVRTVSAANKKFPSNLAYVQLFFDILGT